MKKVVLILVIIPFILSCGSNKTGTTTLDSSNIRSDPKPAVKSRSSKTDTSKIIDDAFIDTAVSALTLERLTHIYKPEKLLQKQSKFEVGSDKMVTTFYFKAANDSAFFMQGGEHKTFPVLISSTSNKLIIDNDIKIGADKSIFENKFKKQPLANIVQIENVEGGCVFTFFFKEDKLIKILYKAEDVD